MIQKGIVKEVQYAENRIVVRIPLYETAGGNEALFTCVIANQPGIINGYTEGDVVFVDFENDDLDHPLIIASLYRGSGYPMTKSGFTGDSIDVNGSARFSSDFQVGEITYRDLLSLKKYLNLVEEGNGIFDEIKIDGGEIT